MLDLMLAGGRVLDPGRGLDALLDVAISGGRIVRIAAGLDRSEARRVIDVRGRLVTPGLIDMHAHVAAGLGVAGLTESSLEPDLAGVGSGVTTVVDGGSTGAATFGAVRAAARRSRTRVLAFAHLARTGQATLPEPFEPGAVDEEAAAAVVRAHPGLAVGVKLRLVSPGIAARGEQLVREALRAARASSSRLMVHIGDTTNPPSREPARELTPRLLDLMAPGDIVTHVYTANPGGLLDEKGRVLPQVHAARERGVVLDAAHGRRNFSFEAARRLLDQGVVADVISSDLTAGGRGEIVWSLTECMSKFLMLGMSLAEVIERTTAAPARALGLEGELGALEVGRVADLSVLEVAEGRWLLRDAFGRSEVGDKAIVPVLAVRAGEPIAPEWGPHPWGWLPEEAEE